MKMKLIDWWKKQKSLEKGLIIAVIIVFLISLISIIWYNSEIYEFGVPSFITLLGSLVFWVFFLLRNTKNPKLYWKIGFVMISFFILLLGLPALNPIVGEEGNPHISMWYFLLLPFGFFAIVLLPEEVTFLPIVFQGLFPLIILNFIILLILGMLIGYTIERRKNKRGKRK